MIRRSTIVAASAFIWGTVAGVSLAIVAAGNAQTPNPNGIGTLYLDNVPVATFTQGHYELDTGDFYMATHEIVLECLTDRVFHDDFEGGEQP